MKIKQFLNYLSINALEDVGILSPTQKQITCIETCLVHVVNYTCQNAANAVFRLHQTGISDPSNSDIKKIMQKLYEGMTPEKI